MSLLQADWSETDLAAFARYHYGRAFHALSDRQLRLIIDLAYSRSHFARLFRKERSKHPIAAYASPKN